MLNKENRKCWFQTSKKKEFKKVVKIKKYLILKPNFEKKRDCFLYKSVFTYKIIKKKHQKYCV